MRRRVTIRPSRLKRICGSGNPSLITGGKCAAQPVVAAGPDARPGLPLTGAEPTSAAAHVTAATAADQRRRTRLRRSGNVCVGRDTTRVTISLTPDGNPP
jgi:hypothetical protein